MKISLIISFYKNFQALELILKALCLQSFKDFEVLISEDNNALETVDFLKEAQKISPFTIKHVSQENKGFRKCRILNKALKLAEADYIVFLDGDCVPHRHFLKAYADNFSEYTILRRRRVMLDKKTTENLYKTKDLSRLTFLSLLFSKSTRYKYALYLPFLNKKVNPPAIWGCNWGIHKRWLFEINGFNEDYITAGYGEDVDIEYRLNELGKLTIYSINYAAIQFHLYHDSNYNEKDLEKSRAVFDETIKNRQIICKNGLEKL